MTTTDVTFVTPVRAALAEGDEPAARTISGLGVPFGVESLPDSASRSRYVFAGAPANVDELVDVVREHADDQVVGRLAAAWEPTEDGMPAVARIFRTRDGDDLLELAREGVLTGFSVSTEIAKFTEAPGGVRHVAAGDYTVRHLGVVRRPAFQAAAGLTIAAASAAPEGTTVTTTDVVELPTIAELAAQTAPVVAELLEQATRTRRHPLAEFATFGDYAYAVLHAADPDRAVELQAAFAVADQVTTDNPGVIPPGWRESVVMNLDARRPAITGTGGPIALPPAGMDANWPFFDGDLDAIIAEQITEKTDLSGPKISIEKGTAPIHTAGAVSDISYQLLLRSSPSYLDAYLRILQAAWARYTEAKFELALVDAATNMGEADDDVAVFRGQLFAASSAVEDATGSPATVVGVSKDLWTYLGGQPTLYNPAYGTQNAGGTSSAATLQINVNGLNIVRWPFLPTDTVIVTNGDAARFAEYGPQVATAEDVRKLGRDVAVWGMYEEAEVYFPAGVVMLAAEATPPAVQSTKKLEQGVSETPLPDPAPRTPRAVPGVVTPITPEDVKAWLRIDDDTDDEILQSICDAVMVWVAALPYVAGLDPLDDWPADVRQGAVQLAARWYRRRLSPSGIDAITDAGAVYVARSDPEISQLLHLDNWAYPRVG